MDTTLIIPGLNGSGPDHWQSWFERQLPNSVRVIQSDWETPDLPRWAARVRRELNRAEEQQIVAALEDLSAGKTPSPAVAAKKIMLRHQK